jgi:hypothetical protein
MAAGSEQGRDCPVAIQCRPASQTNSGTRRHQQYRSDRLRSDQTAQQLRPQSR